MVKSWALSALLGLAGFLLVGNVWAEKLTTVAVVDLDKIYQSVGDQPKKIKEFEQTKQAIQDELNGHVAVLNKLKEQRLEAAGKNDTSTVQRLDQEIAQKNQFIADFRRVKQAQLEEMTKTLRGSDSLSQDIDNTIIYIAISEGYTVVLQAGAQSDLYWWSSEVDITQKVIRRLKDTGKY